MKIFHISASYKPAYVYGGPTMSVAKLVEELGAYLSDTVPDFEMEVLTTTANGELELSVTPGEATFVDGVQVTFYRRITKDHSHFSPSLAKALLGKIIGHRAKHRACRDGAEIVVHIHGWWNLVSVTSCVIAILTGCRVILSPRGTLSNYSFNNRSSLLKKLFHYVIGSRLLKRCHFHVTTGKERSDILALLDPRSIATIPNIVAFPGRRNAGSATARPQRTKNGERRLLFLSRIEEKKGLDILLRALAGVNFPYTLTIAGTGTKAYLAEMNLLVQSLKLHPECLKWLGHQGQTEKFDIYSAHDLLVLPSHDENFGNVVIESLYAGTPVLVSDKVGLAGYVEEKNLGWVCKTTPGSVTSVLNEIFDKDLAKLTGVSRRSQEAIQSDFHTRTIINQYSLLYQSGINDEKFNNGDNPYEERGKAHLEVYNKP